MKKKKLLIEAISTSSGGAIIHLKHILSYSIKQNYFDEITVILPKKTYYLMPKNKNIKYIYNDILSSNLILRIFWQVILLNIYIRFKKFDSIFITGSSHLLFSKNITTINQNLLPFTKNEVDKYFFSYFYLKLKLLKFTQKFSLKLSNKIIFLHKYSKKKIISQTGILKAKTKVIPHGVDLKEIKFNKMGKKKIRFIYISNIDYYKNQTFIVDAFNSLFSEFPSLKDRIFVEFYGGYYKPALDELILKLNHKNTFKKNFKFYGVKKISEIYKNKKNFCTISLFASSCENFSVSLIESMAVGFPILCVKLDPMKSVLGNTAFYYKHKSIKNLKLNILKILKNPKKLELNRIKALKKSKFYNNEKMALQTYQFLNSK